jgi:hypothetical protein
VAIAAFRPLTAASAVAVPTVDQYVPANSFALAAKEEGDGSVVLSWPSQRAHGAHVVYEIFREPTDGLVCTLRRHSAAVCVFQSDGVNDFLVPLIRTAATSFRDHPDPGPWVYRVAATISGDPKVSGDLMLLSRAAPITESAY